jgi:hypothetical protein
LAAATAVGLRFEAISVNDSVPFENAFLKNTKFINSSSKRCSFYANLGCKPRKGCRAPFSRKLYAVYDGCGIFVCERKIFMVIF